MAIRSTRGAGLSWGYSEDSGLAVRWLCAHGFDGCGALSALFGNPQEKSGTLGGPREITSTVWLPSGDRLCPIRAGATLSDAAYLLRTSEITLEAVAVPVLILPFAAAAARMLEAEISFAWQKFSGWTDGQRLYVATDIAMPIQPGVPRVMVRLGQGSGIRVPRQSRAWPNPRDWSNLEQLAERTYAPATDESRMLGAGAGLTDND